MNILSRYRSPRYSKGFHVVDTSKISEGVEGIYLFFLSEGFNAHPIPSPIISENSTNPWSRDPFESFFWRYISAIFPTKPHPCLFLRGLALGKNRGLKAGLLDVGELTSQAGPVTSVELWGKGAMVLGAVDPLIHCWSTEVGNSQLTFSD